MRRPFAIAGRNGTLVCRQCTLADTALRRMRGLLGRKALARGEGLLLRPAPAVHTWFMRFPIDAVFLGRDLTVLRVAPEIRPWRMVRCRGARAVLELQAGEAGRRGVAQGDQLELLDAA